MKICLYSPYVPKHVGGGEKYFFDVARELAELGHEVYVGVPNTTSPGLFEEISSAAKIRRQYEQFLDCSLEKVRFITTPIGGAASFFEKLFWTRHFDVMYYLTDGSLFFSLAPRNILHIQFPFAKPKKSFMDRVKLWNWSVKNTNSAFTKQVIEQHWQTEVQYVHHPMVTTPQLSPKFLSKKEKVIVHVGRFFRQLHSKRQDVLVEIFRELIAAYPKQTKAWQLVLIGSVEDPGYAAEVARQAKGLPIKVIHQVSRPELEKWYAKAAMYWHATGYSADEKTEPEKTEHFGISTVEAMSYGCVPVVIGKGGQPEVLGEQLQDWLWLTKNECIEKTAKLIEDTDMREHFARVAVEQAQTFNREKFVSTLQAMIKR